MIAYAESVPTKTLSFVDYLYKINSHDFKLYFFSVLVCENNN